MHANPEIYISHTRVSTASVLGPYKILAQNYKSFMYWVYSSAVERLTADQQVPGSNPGVPFYAPSRSISRICEEHYLIQLSQL